MLSFERTKELLSELQLSDEELEDVRAVSWMIAAEAFNMWSDERKETKKDEHITNSNEGSGA